MPDKVELYVYGSSSRSGHHRMVSRGMLTDALRPAPAPAHRPLQRPRQVALAPTHRHSDRWHLPHLDRPPRDRDLLRPGHPPDETCRLDAPRQAASGYRPGRDGARRGDVRGVPRRAQGSLPGGQGASMARRMENTARASADLNGSLLALVPLARYVSMSPAGRTVPADIHANGHPHLASRPSQTST